MGSTYVAHRALDSVERGIAVTVWDEIDSNFRAFAQERHSPGLVAGVVVDGALVHTLAHGIADVATGRMTTVDDRFRIASMTKSFTALAILALRDQGLLGLDALVSDVVPELVARAPLTADSAALTVRDLLHHLGGDVTDDPWADRQLGMSPAEFSAHLTAGWPASRPSGTAFGYSNLGYALLGRVIQAVSGTTYQAYIRTLLFEPLGMTATTFDFHDVPPGLLAAPHRWATDHLVADTVEPDGEFGAMGGIITTVGDFALYCRFLLDGWPARDDTDDGPVRRSTVRELVNGHGLPRLIEMGAGIPAVAGVYGYGMIAQLDPDLGEVIQHSGGLPGYGSNVMLFPNLGAAVFSFANVTYAAPIAANRWAAHRLTTAGLIAPRSIPVSDALEQAAAAALVVYQTGNFDPVLESAASNLMADIPLHERSTRLKALRETYGECSAHVIEPEHLLAGKLVLTCANGSLAVDIRLTPTAEPQVQVLTFLGRDLSQHR